MNVVPILTSKSTFQRGLEHCCFPASSWDGAHVCPEVGIAISESQLSPVVMRLWCSPQKKRKNPKGIGVCILRRTLKRNSCCFNEEQPVVGCSGVLLPLLHAEVCPLRWTRPAGNLRADPQDEGATKYTIWHADSIGGRWRSPGEKLRAPYLFCCSRSSPRAGQPVK